MEKKREITLTVDDLRNFESEVVDRYEGANIRGPIHLSHGNEQELIDIFQYVDKNDWVFSTWRNHYHALLHGIDKNWLMNEILQGRSINTSNGEAKFHTSAIVGGIIPIATGVAMAIKRRNDMNFVEYHPEIRTMGWKYYECKVCGYKGGDLGKGRKCSEHFDKTHVWCFIGDMAYSGGAFYESHKYAVANQLPITYVVEDNGLSTNTPTQKSWDYRKTEDTKTYHPFGVSEHDKKSEIPNVTLFDDHLWYYQYDRYYPHVGIGKWIYF